jgi:bifunctional non-homologous end joining protein LigD
VSRQPTPQKRTRAAAAKDKPVVRGVAISSADRVMYPDVGITKLELVRYVDAVADWLLPHVADRPLSLVFCPDGIAGECVYLKHGKTWGPASLRRVKIREKTKVGEYMVADSPEALVAIMQMNWVEMHTWNACASSLEQPNRLVIDLDPGPEVRWPQVVAAAREVRGVLQARGVEAWLKTTGGRGLHVVVPLLDGVSWAAGFAFAAALAETLVQEKPRLYTTAFAKEGREAQILVDVLRNRRGSTVVSAYSPRARAGATVSTPIAWDELSARRRPDRFTVRTVPARLAKLGADPWQGYWTCRQTIPE